MVGGGHSSSSREGTVLRLGQDSVKHKFAYIVCTGYSIKDCNLLPMNTVEVPCAWFVSSHLFLSELYSAEQLQVQPAVSTLVFFLRAPDLEGSRFTLERKQSSVVVACILLEISEAGRKCMPCRGNCIPVGAWTFAGQCGQAFYCQKPRATWTGVASQCQVAASAVVAACVSCTLDAKVQNSFKTVNPNEDSAARHLVVTNDKSMRGLQMGSGQSNAQTAGQIAGWQVVLNGIPRCPASLELASRG